MICAVDGACELQPECPDCKQQANPGGKCVRSLHGAAFVVPRRLQDTCCTYRDSQSMTPLYTTPSGYAAPLRPLDNLK
jgi:hypothetical protein